MTIGDIGSVIGTLVFEATRGDYPTIQQISDDLHCLAYAGPDSDGWARSVNITDAGIITEPASNTLEFDTGQAAYNKACVNSTGILCNFYRSEDTHRYIEAIKVNSNGTLEQHASSRLLFAANDYTFGPPIHIDGDIVAIAYSSNDGTVHVCTIDVSLDGEVTDPVVDDYQTQVIVQGYPSIAHIVGNVYVIVYQDGSNYGYALSVNISTSGSISATGQSQVDITGQYNWQSNLIKLKDNTFICVHVGPDEDGFAAVFECSDSGVVTVPTNNLYEFPGGHCETPWALRISDNVFAVVFTGPDLDGYLLTIKCELASAATWTHLNYIEFDTSHCDDPQIIKRATGIYSICYTGAGNTGVLKTYPIQDAIPTGGHTEMILGIGP